MAKCAKLPSSGNERARGDGNVMEEIGESNTIGLNTGYEITRVPRAYVSTPRESTVYKKS